MSVRRRLTASVVAVAFAATAFVAGCGGGGGSNVDVGPAAAVPAETPIYIDATVRPTGTAEAGAKAAAAKIMDTSDPGGKLISLITQSSQHFEKPGETFNWQEDVEPWLGEKVGIFYDSLAPGGDPTFVFESKNNQAALTAEREDIRDTGRTENYHGDTYDVIRGGKAFGAVDNFIVYGPTKGFQEAVDASQGDSLGDSGDFTDAIGDLPENRLGTFYTIPQKLLDALPNTSSQLARNVLEKTAGDSLNEPVSGALTASAQSIDLEFTGGSRGVETPESSLLGTVPSRAWLALGVGNLGDSLKRELERLKAANIPGLDIATAEAQIQAATGFSIDDLAAALGDGVVYLQGSTVKTLSGALVVQAKDPAVTSSLLDKVQGLIQFSGGQFVQVTPLLGSGLKGFQIVDKTGTIPAPVEFAQQGDKLVIGYGAGSAQQALAGGQRLSADPTFSQAQGQVSSLGTDFFFNFPLWFQLADSSSAIKSPRYQQAKPYLDALNYFVSGSGTKNDKTEVKAVLGLK